MRTFLFATIINLGIALTAVAMNPEPQPFEAPFAVAKVTKTKAKNKKRKSKKKSTPKKTAKKKKSYQVNKYWEMGYDEGFIDGRADHTGY